MNKREFKELEKVFAAEIEGRLYQAKNQIVKKLEEEGYIQIIEKILGKDRLGIIKVSGYVTTLKGNLHYCINC